MDISISNGTIVVFSFYIAALFALIFIDKPLRSLAFSALAFTTIITSYFFELVDLLGLIASILLWSVAYSTSLSLGRSLSAIWTILVLACLALAFHAIPGFTNELIFGPEYLGQSDLKFKLYANIDKAWAGLMLVAAFRPYLRIKNSFAYLKKDIRRILIGLVVIFGTGLALGVKLDPKFGQLTLAFLILNLFVTCLAEEGFFRLVIQDGLEKGIKHRWGTNISLVISALIFTLAHFHVGPGATERLALIFLAGLTYAWVYVQNRSFVSAVLAHFSVNFIHLSFFVYPATF